jgi:uncharacterized protein (TIGR03435 family)
MKLSRRAIVLFVFGGSTTLFVQGQEPPPPIQFDAVSLKLDATADPSLLVQTSKKIIRPAYHSFRYTPGRVTCSLPLISMIAEAYEVEFWRVSGPKWIYDGVYQLVATMPADASRDTARLMLRTALSDRFGLTFHWVNQSTPVYELVLGSNGSSKLIAATVDAKSKRQALNGYFSGAESLDDFAKWLYNSSDLPVINNTGLPGAYKIELKWAPEKEEGAPSGFKDVALFSAIEDHLGIKLRRTKVEMKVFVIDQVDRPPKEN